MSPLYHSYQPVLCVKITHDQKPDLRTNLMPGHLTHEHKSDLQTVSYQQSPTVQLLHLLFTKDATPLLLSVQFSHVRVAYINELLLDSLHQPEPPPRQHDLQPQAPQSSRCNHGNQQVCIYIITECYVFVYQEHYLYAT
jgi:hypothetical protein